MTSLLRDLPRADAGRLASITEPQALRFRDALAAAGYLPSGPDEIPKVLELRAHGGRNLPRLLHATSAERPLDVFARLFLLGVPVRESAARAAMASPPLEEWREAGLVRVEGDRVDGLVAIAVYEGLLLAFDKPELLERGAADDLVSGMTNSTVALAASMARRDVENVLDLGTGCGVLAFLAARRGGRVLATDLTPRAIQFASFNARLNGIHNVEFAAGDGFEPACGRKFDLVLANLPFVLGPEKRYAFRDNGLDLDEFCRRIIGAAPEYLNEGGLFQSTAEWPNLGDADWRKRPGEWLRDSPLDGLVLRIRDTEALRHAEETVCETDVLDLEEQVRLYRSYAEYFETRNVKSVSEGLLVLRRRKHAASPWLRLEEVSGLRADSLGAAVGRYFEVADALERLGEKLFDLRLRPARTTSLATSRTWNGEGWEAAGYTLRQNAGFGFESGLDVHIANLVRQCDGTKTLREVAAGIAADAGATFEAVAPGCLEAVRWIVQRGFLVLPG